MAVTSNTQIAPFGAVTLYRLVAASERAVETIGTWRRANAVERSLSRMTDRELSDIGMFRGDIPRIAREMATRA